MRFKNYLTEKVLIGKDAQTNLIVFDIDDTLFRTKSSVWITKGGKRIKKLSSVEYNKYKLKPGEKFDYAEFRDAFHFKKTAQPIDKMLDRARAYINKTGPKHKTIMLTARADMDNKKVFLQVFRDHGIKIDDVYIERSGNLMFPATKGKKIVFNKYLSTGKYNSVTFFDDHMDNIRSFMSLRKRYPGISFTAFLVNPNNGAIKEVK